MEGIFAQKCNTLARYRSENNFIGL